MERINRIIIYINIYINCILVLFEMIQLSSMLFIFEKMFQIENCCFEKKISLFMISHNLNGCAFKFFI